MSDMMWLGGSSFSRGDKVQQVALDGLIPLDGLLYVIDAAHGELVLSRVPGGPVFCFFKICQPKTRQPGRLTSLGRANKIKRWSGI